MKLSLFRHSRPPSESAEVAELDVTPVMNMFVILIPFLVSMAVFTHLSIIEFSVPPNVGPGLDQSSGKPKLRLTVRCGFDYVAIISGDQMLDSMSVDKGIIPFDSLATKLAIRRKETQMQEEITIAARDHIPFKHVVTVMDICRDVGFSKVGLSSATENPGAGT